MPKGLRESTDEDENWCAKCTNYTCEKMKKLDGIMTGKCRIDETTVKRSNLCDEFELDALFIYVKQTIKNLEKMGL